MSAAAYEKCTPARAPPPNDTSFTTTVTDRRYNHLLLNNLVQPIPQIIQGNTILHPSHRDERGALRKFDCIWSCPMFIRHDTATRSCLK
ncbi:MAG: hypothetical protein WCP35_01075 [Verrucomicrobiota bacterium]